VSIKVRRYTAAACLAVKSSALVPAIVSNAIGKPGFGNRVTRSAQF